MTFKIRIPTKEDVAKVAEVTLRKFGERYAKVLSVAFADRKRGRCPFCGGGLVVDYDGSLSDGKYEALYHDLPMCSDYESRSADEYVEAVLDKATREGR